MGDAVASRAIPPRPKGRGISRSFDDEDLPAAKVETFDNCEAHIEVTMLVNAASWKELSEKIHESLLMMKLEGDGNG